MTLRSDPTNPRPPPPNSSEHDAPKPHSPPPMREVTKGWFTMREEPKTIEQLQKADDGRE